MMETTSTITSARLSIEKAGTSAEWSSIVVSNQASGPAWRTTNVPTIADRSAIAYANMIPSSAKSPTVTIVSRDTRPTGTDDTVPGGTKSNPIDAAASTSPVAITTAVRTVREGSAAHARAARTGNATTRSTRKDVIGIGRGAHAMPLAKYATKSCISRNSDLQPCSRCTGPAMVAWILGPESISRYSFGFRSSQRKGA